jgi:malate dehydrogenase (oxaloacetate-decarboxylating)(NADP+)
VLSIYFSQRAADVGATTINEAMKLPGAVLAIAELAQAEQSDVVAMAYGWRKRIGLWQVYNPRRTTFLIRLIDRQGCTRRSKGGHGPTARCHQPDYRLARLSAAHGSICLSCGLIMKPVFSKAKQAPKQVFMPKGRG